MITFLLSREGELCPRRDPVVMIVVLLQTACNPVHQTGSSLVIERPFVMGKKTADSGLVQLRRQNEGRPGNKSSLAACAAGAEEVAAAVVGQPCDRVVPAAAINDVANALGDGVLGTQVDILKPFEEGFCRSDFITHSVCLPETWNHGDSGGPFPCDNDLGDISTTLRLVSVCATLDIAIVEPTSFRSQLVQRFSGVGVVRRCCGRDGKDRTSRARETGWVDGMREEGGRTGTSGQRSHAAI